MKRSPISKALHFPPQKNASHISYKFDATYRFRTTSQLTARRARQPLVNCLPRRMTARMANPLMFGSTAPLGRDDDDLKKSYKN